MEAIAHDLQMEETIHPELSIVETNLFELIDAVIEEVEPEEDWLVNEVVLDLLIKGGIRFLDPVGETDPPVH